MTLLGIVIVGAVYSLAPGIVVGLPISHAVLRGLGSAREPVHRVTPLSPWVYFRRATFRSLRWWILVWAFIFVGWSIYQALVLRSGNYHSIHGSIHLFQYALHSIRGPLNALSMGGVCAGLCMLLGPHIRGFWSLAGAVAICLMPFGVGLMLVPYYLWRTSLEGMSEIGVALVQFVFMALVPLLPGVLFLTATIWHARRRGDRWFRFEN